MDLTWVEPVLQFVVGLAAKIVAVTATLWVMTRIMGRVMRRTNARLTWPLVPRRPSQKVETLISTAFDRDAAITLSREVLASFDGVDEHVCRSGGSTLVQGLLPGGPLGLPSLAVQFEVPDAGQVPRQVGISIWPLRGFGWHKECAARLTAVRGEWRERELVDRRAVGPA